MILPSPPWEHGMLSLASSPVSYLKGVYQAASGNAAVKALSWDEVDSIREKFEALNPWRDTLNVPFLKLEPENFDSDGERHQLYAHCVSAKLYCLFNLDGNRLLVRKPSGYGLGVLQAPTVLRTGSEGQDGNAKKTCRRGFLRRGISSFSRGPGLPHKPPSWLTQPAVMAVPVTTPQVLARLGVFKDDLRPFTVVTVPVPKRETVRDPLWSGYFIMPHTEKLNDLHGRTMVNIVSGGANRFSPQVLATEIASLPNFASRSKRGNF